MLARKLKLQTIVEDHILQSIKDRIFFLEEEDAYDYLDNNTSFNFGDKRKIVQWVQPKQVQQGLDYNMQRKFALTIRNMEKFLRIVKQAELSLESGKLKESLDLIQEAQELEKIVIQSDLRLLVEDIKHYSKTSKF